MRLNLLHRIPRRAFAFCHDLAVAAIAFGLGVWLRLGDDIAYLPPVPVLQAMGVFVVTCGAVFWLNGLYRSVWVFSSLVDLTKIIRAATIAVVGFVLISFLVTRLEGVPRTVPFIAWFILLGGLCGSRMAIRLARERRLSALWQRFGRWAYARSADRRGR